MEWKALEFSAVDARPGGSFEVYGDLGRSPMISGRMLSTAKSAIARCTWSS
jgi:hypothetical protein